MLIHVNSVTLIHQTRSFSMTTQKANVPGFLCDFGCGESFDNINEENLHMNNVHNWG